LLLVLLDLMGATRPISCWGVQSGRIRAPQDFPLA